MKAVLFLVIAAFCTLSAQQASAQSKVRVKFAAGKSETTVSGTVRGYSQRDYVVRAAQGQTIDLKLISTHNPSIFSVFTSKGENLDGAIEKTDFSETIPATGDYVISVLMMRSEARRKGSMSNYTLKISIR